MPKFNLLSSKKNQIIASTLLDVVSDTSKTAMVISQTVLSREGDLGSHEGVRNTMPYVSTNQGISTSAKVMSKLIQKEYMAALQASLDFIPFFLMMMAQNQDDEYNATIFFDIALLLQAIFSILSACASTCKKSNDECMMITIAMDPMISLLSAATFSGITLDNKPKGMFNVGRDPQNKFPDFSPETVMYSMHSAVRGIYSLGMFLHSIWKAKEAKNPENYTALNELPSKAANEEPTLSLQV